MFKKLLIASFLFVTSLVSGEVKILAFSGSTRQESYNKQLVEEAAAMARKLGATVTVIDLKEYPMPFYDGDLEEAEGMPVKAQELRELIRSHDGILIASPNYNCAPPGVLKNALDWASRSEEGGEDRKVFKGKTVALLSTSPGKTGGSKGLFPLQLIMESLGAEVLTQHVSVPLAPLYFAQKDRPENAAIQMQMESLVAAVLQNQN